MTEKILQIHDVKVPWMGCETLVRIPGGGETWCHCPLGGLWDPCQDPRGRGHMMSKSSGWAVRPLSGSQGEGKHDVKVLWVGCETLVRILGRGETWCQSPLGGLWDPCQDPRGRGNMMSKSPWWAVRPLSGPGGGETWCHCPLGGLWDPCQDPRGRGNMMSKSSWWAVRPLSGPGGSIMSKSPGWAVRPLSGPGGKHNVKVPCVGFETLVRIQGG